MFWALFIIPFQLANQNVVIAWSGERSGKGYYDFVYAFILRSRVSSIGHTIHLLHRSKRTVSHLQRPTAYCCLGK